MKLTKYNQLKHGMRVKCEIEEIKIENARLSIGSDGKVFICQNKMGFETAINRLGYKYDWWLTNKNENIEDWNKLVTNLRSVAKRGRPKKNPMTATEKIVNHAAKNANQYKMTDYHKKLRKIISEPTSDEVKKKLIRLKIEDKFDRGNVVIALANNGYKVWIEKKKLYGSIQDTIYYVCFEAKEEK